MFPRQGGKNYGKHDIGKMHAPASATPTDARKRLWFETSVAASGTSKIGRNK
jgi:hypothetical protein